MNSISDALQAEVLAARNSLALELQSLREQHTDLLSADREEWEQIRRQEQADLVASGNALIQADNPKMTDGQIAFAIEKLRASKAVDGGDAATQGIGVITTDRYKKIYDFLVAGGLLDPKTDWKKAIDVKFVQGLKVGVQ